MFPLPEEASMQLRCSFCKEYLSRFPIYSYSENQDVGCGRCPVLSDRNPIRNLIYEAVAKHFDFPCRFSIYGCIETNPAILMEEHEKSCLYKRYVCPFIPLASCHWQGAAYELFEHYQQEHGSFALTKPVIELDLDKTNDGNYLLVDIGKLFLVNVELDKQDNMIWLGLRFIGDHKSNQGLMYKLELKQPGYGGSIILPSLLVESDVNMFLNKKNAYQITISKIQAIMGNSQVIVLKLSIWYSSYTNKNLFVKTIGKSFDENLLEQLVCPVCNDYMVPPISQCAKGHSMCFVCDLKRTYCCVCGAKVYNTRNFILEKMTECINYHCKYRDSGCSFVSKSDVIKKHQSDECKYASFICPFASHSVCDWNGGLSKIIKHVREEHEEYVIVGNTLTWSYRDEDDEGEDRNCYIIEHMGFVFRVLFQYNSREFFWNVQLVSVKQETGNFMFELDFADNSGKGQRFVTRLNCGQYLLDSEEDMPQGTYVRQNYKMLSHLMDKERGLTCKCHIIKKAVK